MAEAGSPRGPQLACRMGRESDGFPSAYPSGKSVTIFPASDRPRKTATVLFAADNGRVLYCDDISTATALTIYTDDGGDGTFENTWATTDFNLEPINALNGWPFTSIVTTINGNYSFPVYVPRGVKITAAFGWVAVPKSVHEACMMIAASDYKQRNGETVGDVARVTSAGVVLTPGGIPKAAMQKLTPYMRLV